MDLHELEREVAVLRSRLEVQDLDRIAGEATWQVAVLELIGLLVESGSLNADRVRSRFEEASAEIMPVPGHSSPGVRIFQRLADGVAKQHKLAARARS